MTIVQSKFRLKRLESCGRSAPFLVLVDVALGESLGLVKIDRFDSEEKRIQSPHVQNRRTGHQNHFHQRYLGQPGL
jgi:hypothetical protein